jgi:tRNA(Arg) A34 adenosine deaminase TadA
LENQAISLQFDLPSWLSVYVGDTDTLPTVEQRMAFVIGAAKKNVASNTGGPFAAAVFESHTGKLVSLGVNLVTNQGISILHAEMVAIALAQRKLGIYDLGGAGVPEHELVASTEPCAMCFGAVPWSGVKRLVTGARDEDARRIGFDEGPKLPNWKAALEERGIAVTTDILREAAAEVLRDYLTSGGHIYNSREQP